MAEPKIKKRRAIFTLTEDKDGQIKAQVVHEPSIKKLDMSDIRNIPPVVIASFRLAALIKRMGQSLGMTELPAPEESRIITPWK